MGIAPTMDPYEHVSRPRYYDGFDMDYFEATLEILSQSMDPSDPDYERVHSLEFVGMLWDIMDSDLSKEHINTYKIHPKGILFYLGAVLAGGNSRYHLNTYIGVSQYHQELFGTDES